MAGSRLERIGTIFSRMTGLMERNAIQWSDRPLWYDVYEVFPPFKEPVYDRPAPNIPLRKIFYEEDKIRAIFQRNNKYTGLYDMKFRKQKSLTQRFVDAYQVLKQRNPDNTEEQLYKETIDVLKRKQDSFEDSFGNEVLPALNETFKLASSDKERKWENKPLLEVDLASVLKQP